MLFIFKYGLVWKWFGIKKGVNVEKLILENFLIINLNDIWKICVFKFLKYKIKFNFFVVFGMLLKCLYWILKNLNNYIFDL